MEAQRSVVDKRLQSYHGKRIRVLLEGQHGDTDLLMSARAEWQAPETDGEIIVNDVDEDISSPEGFSMDKLVGEFVEVEVTESLDYDLVGKIVSVD